MQITINVPDEFANQVQSRGIALETYVEQLLTEQIAHSPASAGKKVDLERFFAEVSAGTEGQPLPSEEAFSRESFYSDHD